MDFSADVVVGPWTKGNKPREIRNSAQAGKRLRSPVRLWEGFWVLGRDDTRIAARLIWKQSVLVRPHRLQGGKLAEGKMPIKPESEIHVVDREVALELGHKFVGIEIMHSHFETAKHKLAALPIVDGDIDHAAP